MHIFTTFQSDDVIYEVTVCDQNKSVRTRAVKNVGIRRTGGAVDRTTILFLSLEGHHFKLSKTRRTSPECIKGFSI